MTLRTLLATGTFAALLGSSALAADQTVLDQIVQDLAAQGYQHIEIKNAPDWVKVEAYGPNGALEQMFDGQGQLLREQLRDGSGTRSASASTGGTGASASDDDANDDQYDDVEDDDDDSPDRTRTRTQARVNEDDDHDQPRTRTQTRAEKHDDHDGNDDD